MGKRIQEFLRISGFVTRYIQTEAGFGETTHNASCNSAYRKIIFEEIGGFDEAQFPGEDLELRGVPGAFDAALHAVSKTCASWGCHSRST